MGWRWGLLASCLFAHLACSLLTLSHLLFVRGQNPNKINVYLSLVNKTGGHGGKTLIHLWWIKIMLHGKNNLFTRDKYIVLPRNIYWTMEEQKLKICYTNKCSLMQTNQLYCRATKKMFTRNKNKICLIEINIVCYLGTYFEHLRNKMKMKM